MRRRDCLGHSHCLCCPKTIFLPSLILSKTLKTLFKTHIFHEAFPDSRCLYPILITLITLAKVIVGCICLWDSPHANIMLQAPRGQASYFLFPINYIHHSFNWYLGQANSIPASNIYLFRFYRFWTFLVPVSVIYVNIFVLAIIMCV